jgi:Asp/Glu/hydantoin racemase
LSFRIGCLILTFYIQVSKGKNMRILVANVAVAQKESEAGHFIRNTLVPLWRRNMDAVRQPGTEFTFRFPEWGVTGLDGFFYSFMDQLNARSVFHAAVQAEREGFDAVMISCFGDPMLWAIRQAVNIPVVSLGESSMLLAAMMGHKFGIVTVSPYNIFEMDHTIEKYGLAHRYAGASPNPESGDQQVTAVVNAGPAIDAFKKAASPLVEKGAEVIIPGCGLLSPALRFAPGAEDQYPDGFTEVDGVPVLDVLGSAVKAAETLFALKSSNAPWISRKGLYAKATHKALEAGKMVLDDSDIEFWDI